MDLEEAVKRIAKHIESSKNPIPTQDLDIFNKKFVEIEIEEYKVKLRLLSWTEGLEIDKEAFKNNGNVSYFSSEKEKRLILKKVISEIYVDGLSLDFDFENLTHDFIERVWQKYYSYLHLSNSEINYIYNSAKKYFDPNNKDVVPVHPFIIEVDYMSKGIVSFSRNEFTNLTMKEFETIQLILSAKNEVN